MASKQDAEECVNDAYLGAWNAIPPAKPNPLLAFVCKIVRNVSLKRYEKNTAAKRGGGEVCEELTDCIPSNTDVFDEIENKELTRMIDGFLERLDEEKRMMFLT